MHAAVTLAPWVLVSLCALQSIKSIKLPGWRQRIWERREARTHGAGVTAACIKTIVYRCTPLHPLKQSRTWIKHFTRDFSLEFRIDCFRIWNTRLCVILFIHSHNSSSTDAIVVLHCNASIVDLSFASFVSELKQQQQLINRGDLLRCRKVFNFIIKNRYISKQYDLSPTIYVPRW